MVFSQKMCILLRSVKKLELFSLALLHQRCNLWDQRSRPSNWLFLLEHRLFRVIMAKTRKMLPSSQKLNASVFLYSSKPPLVAAVKECVLYMPSPTSKNIWPVRDVRLKPLLATRLSFSNACFKSHDMLKYRYLVIHLATSFISAN